MKTIHTKLTNYFANLLIDIINDKVNDDDLDEWSRTYNYEIEYNFFGDDIIIDVEVYVKVSAEEIIEYLNTGFGDVAYNLGTQINILCWEVEELQISCDEWDIEFNIKQLNRIKY